MTGATGFLGAHVVRALVESGASVRATYRNPDRLDRLGGLDVATVRADVLDRSSLRRAVRGAELVFHTAGLVAARPRERVFEINALAPRLTVEAAAAEGARRVVLTSTVGALGPAPAGEVADERQLYRGGLGLTYADAKHEGEAEALAAAARLGVELVVVNPSYVLGVPVDPSEPGETSTRIVGNYLSGRLPALVDGATNVVDVRDVARGHLLAAEHGRPGERYILGGANLSWVDLIDRVAALSGVHHPVVVLPADVARLGRLQESLGLPAPVAGEGLVLMAQNWRYSSRRARRELGYATRPLERTLRDTIDWNLDLIAGGAFESRGASPLSLAAAGVRLGERLGVASVLRAAERHAGRRLVAGT